MDENAPTKFSTGAGSEPAPLKTATAAGAPCALALNRNGDRSRLTSTRSRVCGDHGAAGGNGIRGGRELEAFIHVCSVRKDFRSLDDKRSPRGTGRRRRGLIHRCVGSSAGWSGPPVSIEIDGWDRVVGGDWPGPVPAGGSGGAETAAAGAVVASAPPVPRLRRSPHRPPLQTPLPARRSPHIGAAGAPVAALAGCGRGRGGGRGCRARRAGAAAADAVAGSTRRSPRGVEKRAPGTRPVREL